MKQGPFKTAIEVNNENVLKEEYTTYRVVDGYLEKTTVVRNHKSSDYHDTTSTERLAKVDEV